MKLKFSSRCDTCNLREPLFSVDTSPVELYERALAKYRQFSLNPNFSTIIGQRGAVLTQLFNQIYNIRREETMGWVSRTLKDKFPNIVAPETASSVEGGKPYKKVNIEASLAAYTDADGKFTGDFGKKFANRAAFISFVSNGLAIQPPMYFQFDLALYSQR